MVRRAQMQKQMDISSTKADKLLKKAKKMNNRMFEKGGVNMTKEKSKKPKTKKPSKRLPFGMDEIFDIKKEFKKIPKSMAKGGLGEDPFKGDKPTGKTDKRGHPQYEREDGTKYYRLPGGDDVKLKGKKMAHGGILDIFDLLKPPMGAAAGAAQGTRKKPQKQQKTKKQQKPQKQQEPMKRNMGGTARSNDAKKSRGAGAMIRGLIFRGVF